jgi:hypothetical protein
MGRGSVHHVAFRAKDDATQAEMAAHLRDRHGLQPTEQKDRQYFRSVYFLEPGGILFEIATDEPGFTVDEAAPTLGKDLKLPPFLESQRKEIEAALRDSKSEVRVPSTPERNCGTHFLGSWAGVSRREVFRRRSSGRAWPWWR